MPITKWTDILSLLTSWTYWQHELTNVISRPISEGDRWHEPTDIINQPTWWGYLWDSSGFPTCQSIQRAYRCDALTKWFFLTDLSHGASKSLHLAFAIVLPVYRLISFITCWHFSSYSSSVFDINPWISRHISSRLSIKTCLLFRSST